jgi:hypothetical protein
MGKPATLSELLGRQRSYHPEYSGGLANHLPMALVALTRMGAPAERLQVYARLYERRLEPAPPEGQVVAGSGWQRHLGQRARYADVLATFRQGMAEAGWPAVLREAVPVLMPGCAAAAFHPLIRLGFAIEAEAPGEMAIALAYWASRFLQLGQDAMVSESISEDPKALLARLVADPAFAHRPDADSLIDADMKRATAMPEFAPVSGWLAIGPDTQRRLASMALEIYAATGDFTALHMVTGVQAARVVLPFCADRDATLRSLWQALAAAYLSIGKPAIPEAPPLDPTDAPDWPAILERAREAADEHVIKIVYSCWVEDATYADPLFRAVAARAIQ